MDKPDFEAELLKHLDRFKPMTEKEELYFRISYKIAWNKAVEQCAETAKTYTLWHGAAEVTYIDKQSILKNKIE